MNIIESAGLGQRYRRTWALRDCTLAVPDGHLVALVGPNGAGKTTLLHMAAGLVSPTAGAVRVLGGQPAGSPGALSGGQQAQLALTVALARRPRLLVLDEPLAALDPVARSDFMAAVLAAVAGDGISVVLSSHMLAELDRVADYLIVLSDGRLSSRARWPTCWPGTACSPARPAKPPACRTPVPGPRPPPGRAGPAAGQGHGRGEPGAAWLAAAPGQPPGPRAAGGAAGRRCPGWPCWPRR